MIPANSIAALRRAPIAGFFALWLILLTVSPFTAPFSTCDDAELTGEMSSLDKRPCSKATDDAADATVVAILCPLAAAFLSVVHSTRSSEPRDRSALLTVLRI